MAGPVMKGLFAKAPSRQGQKKGRRILIAFIPPRTKNHDADYPATKSGNHESTKVRKHEKRSLSSRDHFAEYATFSPFRTFVLSCFRDSFSCFAARKPNFVARFFPIYVFALRLASNRADGFRPAPCAPRP